MQNGRYDPEMFEVKKFWQLGHRGRRAVEMSLVRDIWMVPVSDLGPIMNPSDSSQ